MRPLTDVRSAAPLAPPPPGARCSPRSRPSPSPVHPSARCTRPHSRTAERWPSRCAVAPPGNASGVRRVSHIQARQPSPHPHQVQRPKVLGEIALDLFLLRLLTPAQVRPLWPAWNCSLVARVHSHPGTPTPPPSLTPAQVFLSNAINGRKTEQVGLCNPYLSLSPYLRPRYQSPYLWAY